MIATTLLRYSFAPTYTNTALEFDAKPLICTNV